MTNENQGIQITKEPVFVNEELIIVPMTPIEPVEPPTPEDYEKLLPEPQEEYRDFTRLGAEERDLLINIETTGLLPFNSRIISIAWLDTTRTNAEVQVMASDDEEGMMNEFFDMFERGNFTRVVGWNSSFDYRFLWAIASLYRRPIKRWINVKLRDVQQIYQQVKEAYVYGFQKPNKLSEWAKFMFGTEPYSPQEEVLKRYIAGDFEFVEAFNTQKVEDLSQLYDLSRYISSESFILAKKLELREPETTEEFISDEIITQAGKKSCGVCLAENPAGTSTCIVCGASI